MARSRNLKPGFFKNADLAAMGERAQLLFAGLWPLADREGRLKDDPRWLRVECLPYSEIDDHGVDALLDAMAKGPDPFIVRYEVDGRRFLQVVNWHIHQSPHHTERESLIPPPPEAPPLNNGALTTKEHPAPLEVTSNKESVTRNQEGVQGGEKTPPPELPPSIRTDAMAEAVTDWLAYKAERREGYKPTGLKNFYGHLSNAVAIHGEQFVIERMRKAMASGWKGWDHEGGGRGSPARPEQKLVQL